MPAPLPSTSGSRQQLCSREPSCIHYLAVPIWRKMSSAELIRHVRALGGTVEVVLFVTRDLAYSLHLEHIDAKLSSTIVRLTRRLPSSVPRTGPPLTTDPNKHTLHLYESVHRRHSKHICGIPNLSSAPTRSLSDTYPDPPGDTSASSELDQFLRSNPPGAMFPIRRPLPRCGSSWQPMRMRA